jgi:PAS domain S-box-containing protein
LLVRAIFYHNSIPIVIADNDRKQLDASVGAGSLLGLARDKLIGRRIDDFTEPISRPRIEEMWRLFLRQGQQQGTFRLLEPDGSVQEVEFIAKGNVLPGRHLLVLHKKTAKKQPWGVVGNDDEQIPSWVKDYALFVLAADGRIVEWHSGAERIYGHRREEIVGQHVSRVYVGDEADLRLKLHVELKRTAAEGRLGNEAWHQRKDGARFWANALTMALRDENQELRGFASVVRDFTGRHRTDEALRQGGGRLKQRAPESTVVGIVSGEFDRITEVSDAFLRMVGYSREELIAGNLTWPDLTPPEYSPLDDLAHDEDLMHGACTPFEKAYIRKDGTRVPVLVTGAVLDFSPFRWITFVQDLSDHDREEVIDQEFPAPHIFQEIVGNSSALKRVLGQIEIVAPTDATVLLLGETGTGKELVARAISKLSARPARPFVTVN